MGCPRLCRASCLQTEVQSSSEGRAGPARGRRQSEAVLWMDRLQVVLKGPCTRVRWLISSFHGRSSSNRKVSIGRAPLPVGYMGTDLHEKSFYEFPSLP